MQTQIEVKGLKELENSLRQLENKVAINLLRAAVRKAAAPMLTTARRLVPYDINDPDGPDGYHLRDYMRLQLEPRKYRDSEVEYRLGPARLSQGGDYKIAGGLGKSVKSPNYAHLVEKVTPYLRPAFDRNKGRFLVIFRAELRKGLTRTFKRLGI